MCDSVTPAPQASTENDQSRVRATPVGQGKIFKYRIWDVTQKFLYLHNSELVAGYLQGSNAALEEKIYWVPNRAADRMKFPVILGIQEGTRCLSTVLTGASPTLQLEDTNITTLYKDGENATRFTFFRSYKDQVWTSFESAAHPGWFLCTSSQSNEPISLTQHPGPSHIVDFYFQPS
uniref:Interleukin-1 n=1 Tax=Sphenodon punctatus TaxID=8508 RepID=A0A8D0G6K8_SPHPU